MSPEVGIEAPSVEELWRAAGAALAKKVAAQAEASKQAERMANTWRWLYHHHGLTAREIADGMKTVAEGRAVVLDRAAGAGYEMVRKSVGPRES